MFYNMEIFENWAGRFTKHRKSHNSIIVRVASRNNGDKSRSSTKFGINVLMGIQK